jgi:glycine/D-amino acid oxidase-like deaminating enzyme
VSGCISSTIGPLATNLEAGHAPPQNKTILQAAQRPGASASARHGGAYEAAACQDRDTKSKWKMYLAHAQSAEIRANTKWLTRLHTFHCSGTYGCQQTLSGMRTHQKMLSESKGFMKHQCSGHINGQQAPRDMFQGFM